METPEGAVGIRRHLAERLLPLTWAIALLIGIGVPATYYLLESAALRRIATSYARHLAQQFQGVIVDSPTLWKYQAQKYSQILRGFLPYREVTSIRLLDEGGRLVTGQEDERAKPDGWWNPPVYGGSVPLLFNNRQVGTIRVELSGGALRRATLLLFLLSAGLGGGLAALVYRFPVRVVARMEGRIQELLETIQRANADLEAKVEERTRELRQANAQLQEAVQRAQEASRVKSEFLATMSHELRTPLNAVIGFSQLLTDQLGPSASPRHRKFLNNITESGRHLLDLINGILDLAKVESGKIELQYEEVSLRDLIQQVVAGVQPQAEGKGLTVSSQVQEGLDRVTLDAGKVKQVLYNLVGNAVKFTHDGGQVRIVARLHEGFLEMSVADTGIGIRPEDQRRIFEAFQQIDSSLDRKYPGTGLGLALTKKLVELLGGRIWVQSEIEKGSTFTFSLALPPPVALPFGRAETPPLPFEKAEKGEDEEIEDDPERPLILVVEDDPRAIDLLSAYLREAGYRIAIARSRKEASAKARALRPIAVSLDILLPTEEGWEILQELKADPETREIPVLIVSVLDERPRGLQLGATDYLVKPVSKEDFLSGLARLGIPLSRHGPLQVLAIDDDPMVLDLTRSMLEGRGIALLTACDGPEGIFLARTKKPDLIILDLMMPGMTGFEVVQRLRSDPATSEIPIFICTAKTLTAPERELLSRQVELIIQKGSLQAKDLLQMIAAVRDRRRAAP